MISDSGNCSWISFCREVIDGGRSIQSTIASPNNLRYQGCVGGVLGHGTTPVLINDLNRPPSCSISRAVAIRSRTILACQPSQPHGIASTVTAIKSVRRLNWKRGIGYFRPRAVQRVTRPGRAKCSTGFRSAFDPSAAFSLGVRPRKCNFRRGDSTTRLRRTAIAKVAAPTRH